MRFVLLTALAVILTGCATARQARNYVCQHQEEIKAVLENGCAIPATTPNN